MKTSEVLQKARDQIAESWWDGRSGAEFGTVCMWLAVKRVAGFRLDIADLLSDVISVDRGDGLRAIYDWNDSHSKVEVLAAFDQAISKAKACEAGPTPAETRGLGA